MKVLFAVGHASLSENIAKKYQETYGEKLEYKDVFYFKAILEEVKRDNSYDRIVIAENLEPVHSNVIAEIDKMLFNNIDSITDEIDDSTILFICSESRTRNDPLLGRFYNIGLYNVLVGDERQIPYLCRLIKEPRGKKEAKEYLKGNDGIGGDGALGQDSGVNETELVNILRYFENLKTPEQYIKSFENVSMQYDNDEDLSVIAAAICTQLKNGDDIFAALKRDPRFAKHCEWKKAEVVEEPKEDKKPGLFNFMKNKPGGGKGIKDVLNFKNKGSKTPEPTPASNPTAAPAPGYDPNAAKRQQEEFLKQKQLEELRKQEEELKRRQAELERQQEEKRIREEKFKQQQEAYQKAQQDAQAEMIRKQQEEALRQQQEAQAEMLRQQQAAEIKRQQEAQAEMIRQQQAAELQKQQEAQAEMLRKQQEEAIKKQQEEAIKKQQEAQAEMLRKQQEEAKRQQEAQAEMLRKQQEAEIKRQQEVQAELLRQKQAEEEKRKQEEQARQAEMLRQQAEEEKRRVQEEQLRLQQEEIKRQQEEILRQQQAIQESAYTTPANDYSPYSSGVDNNYSPYSTGADNNYSAYNTSTDSYMSYTPPMSSDVGPAEEENEMKYTGPILEVPSDYKKVVAFVGTNKVGTSFLANSVATLLAMKGVKVSILDMTKNRGLYWFYSDEVYKKLDQVSNCMTNLSNGVAAPIQVGRSRNLSLYTTIPKGREDNRKGYKHRAVIETAKRNCNLLIIDCDFSTPVEYFEQAQEIYLVQDLDIVKCRETVDFLREMKQKRMDWSKFRLIINNEVKCKITPKRIRKDALTIYNDPNYTYNEEIEEIKRFIVIPMDPLNYATYIEAMERGKIAYEKYTEPLKIAFEDLSTMVYGIPGKRKGLFGG